MALTILVTKKEKGVIKRGEGLWDIILNLTCTDGGLEKINRDFSTHYGTGQDPETIIKKLQVVMQEAINDYKAEQVILNHAKLTAGIAYLNTNLVG